ESLGKKVAIGGGCEVEKHPLVAHLLELLVGYLVAVLDRICAGVNRSLYGGFVDGVNGDFQMVAVRFLDCRRQFTAAKVLLVCNFDDIDVMEHILPDRLPCAIRTLNEQELLLKDGISERGIEVLNISFTSRHQLAAGSEDPGTGEAACVDGVAQFSIPVNP